MVSFQHFSYKSCNRYHHNEGIEVLIHIGMDTVNLKGKYFQPKVAQGDTVTRGQLLLTFDQDALVQAGYSIVTPVIVSNTNNF